MCADLFTKQEQGKVACAFSHCLMFISGALLSKYFVFALQGIEPKVSRMLGK